MGLGDLRIDGGRDWLRRYSANRHNFARARRAGSGLRGPMFRLHRRGMLKRLFLLLHLLAFAATPLAADEAKPATAAPATAPVTRDVTPEEAAKLLQENPKILVLDVRTPEEFAKGHLPGAKNVDFLAGDVKKEAPKLDPATPVIVHCAAGGRSAQSLPLLKNQQVVYHLKDGFKGWEKAGQPVEK